MHYKKFINEPVEGFITARISKFIGCRSFHIGVVYEFTDSRIWVAHRIRNARQYLREFILDEEPKKVVDFPKKTL